MILTETQEWVDLYEAIKSETRKSSEKHVNIYVSATDADSVCALRILEVRAFFGLGAGGRAGRQAPVVGLLCPAVL